MDRASNAVDLRQNNRNRIYRFIYGADEGVTKQDIAKKLGLSLPTVSSNLNDMLAEELLCYGKTRASTGGRKPRAITIAPASRYAVGISLTDNSIRFLAADLKMNELAFRQVALPFSADDEYFSSLRRQLEAFLAANRLPEKNLLGVAVSIPGIIKPDRETIEFAPTLNIRNLNISRYMQNFPYPLLLINDAAASGLAEWWLLPQNMNMAYLSVERGLGGAILIGGTNYLGDNLRSGEFGHICIVPGGRKCRCGKRGCFEAYCSTTALTDRTKLTLDEFFARLDIGDAAVSKVWDEYLSHFAQGIVSIRACLDCEIVLGGMLSVYLDKARLAQLWHAVSALDPFDEAKDYIKPSHFKSKSACFGGALHFINRFVNEI